MVVVATGRKERRLVRHIWPPCRSRIRRATISRPSSGSPTRKCTWPMTLFSGAPCQPASPAGTSATRLGISSFNVAISTAPRSISRFRAAVGIDLDAVALGIGEIERLADEMIRRALDRNLASRWRGLSSGRDRPATAAGRRCGKGRPNADRQGSRLDRPRSPATAAQPAPSVIVPSLRAKFLQADDGAIVAPQAFSASRALRPTRETLTGVVTANGILPIVLLRCRQRAVPAALFVDRQSRQIEIVGLCKAWNSEQPVQSHAHCRPARAVAHTPCSG